MSVTKTFLLAALAAIAAVAGQSNAATLDWTTTGTNANGTSAFASFGGGPAIKLTTTAGGKAVAQFRNLQDPLSPIGTLGDLNQLDVSFFLPGTNTTYAASGFAVRLFTNLGATEALVWEGVNNSPNLSATKDAWVDAELLSTTPTSQRFWQRANGQNFDQAANFKTISDFLGGFQPTNGAFTGDVLDANTSIYGVEVSFGSGIAGDFTGYLRSLEVGFGGANPTVYVGNIPEPATLGLAGIAAIGMLAARRRQRTA